MLVGGSVGRKGGRAQAKGEMEERVEGAVEDLDVLTGTVGKIRTKKNWGWVSSWTQQMCSAFTLRPPTCMEDFLTILSLFNQI